MADAGPLGESWAARALFRMKKFCLQCGGSEEAGVVVMFGVCRPCRDAEVRHYMPALFKATNAAQLPQAQLQAVLDWKMSPRGLILHGPSGTCKTRCLWELIKKLAPMQSEMEYFDSVQFGRELSRRFRNDTAEDWLEEIGKRRRLVIFDDLGKMKLTERVECELFGVIDHRYQHQLPVIATTQLSGLEFGGFMTDHRGSALVRRLRDMCSIVDFGNPPPQGSQKTT